MRRPSDRATRSVYRVFRAHADDRSVREPSGWLKEARLARLPKTGDRPAPLPRAPQNRARSRLLPSPRPPGKPTWQADRRRQRRALVGARHCHGGVISRKKCKAPSVLGST
jgi:hypothetical protein